VNILDLVSDPYEREARLVPALFASLPFIVLAGLFAPSLRSDGAWLIAILAACGCLALMRTIVRDRGKAVEAKLWKEWGGMPSIARLRHRDPVFEAAETASFHAKAAAKVEGIVVPSPDQEAANPEQADRTYAQMSRWILSNTRSAKDHPLILKHNIGYGFRRNLYGAKPTMIWTDVILIALALLWGFVTTAGPDRTFYVDVLNWRHAAALMVPAGHLIIVSLVITKDWVRQSADAFSEQLIGAYHTI